MKYRIRKSFTFEAAHQLERAYSTACTDSIHGHSYRVELFLKADCLNGDLMVIDFGMLKPIIDRIKEEYDHSLMLPKNIFKQITIGGKKTRIFACNPTAEVLTKNIYDFVSGELQTLIIDGRVTNGLELEKVRIHETETTWAEYGY